jgi:hypothetical protein
MITVIVELKCYYNIKDLKEQVIIVNLKMAHERAETCR